MIVQAVVEGHGEVAAVPILLRRLAISGNVHDLDILAPIRYSREQIIQGSVLTRAVGLARSRNADGILALFDADDDCPVEAADAVADRLADVAPDIRSGVVVANREYESWFLGSIESLRGRRGIATEAVSNPNPEGRRGAKEEITQRMSGSRAYSPRGDQPAFTALFAMDSAYRTCRSFRRMAKAFGELAELPNGEWPPAEWIDRI